MENSNIGSIMETTMSKMHELVDVNTVVGEPIQTPDGVTVIPVSKVTYGFASGGSDLPVKDRGGFGGGNGAGVKIEPIGFLVISGTNVRMVNIVPPASGAVDRAIEMAPELLDRLDTMIGKIKNKE